MLHRWQWCSLGTCWRFQRQNSVRRQQQIARRPDWRHHSFKNKPVASSRPRNNPPPNASPNQTHHNRGSRILSPLQIWRSPTTRCKRQCIEPRLTSKSRRQQLWKHRLLQCSRLRRRGSAAWPCDLIITRLLPQVLVIIISKRVAS